MIGQGSVGNIQVHHLLVLGAFQLVSVMIDGTNDVGIKAIVEEIQGNPPDAVHQQAVVVEERRRCAISAHVAEMIAAADVQPKRVAVVEPHQGLFVGVIPDEGQRGVVPPDRLRGKPVSAGIEYAVVVVDRRGVDCNRELGGVCRAPLLLRLLAGIRVTAVQQHKAK